MTRLDISAEIDSEYSGLGQFDEFVRKNHVISTGAFPPPDEPQITGVLSPYEGPENFLNPLPDETNWYLEDPDDNRYLLNVNNWAFTFNEPGHGIGMEGEWELYCENNLVKSFSKDKKNFMVNELWEPGIDINDYNGNGVADIYEEELAEKFQPLMLFDTLNYLRPFPVEIHLDYCKLSYRYYDNRRYEYFRKPGESWEEYFERAYNFNGHGWNNGSYCYDWLLTWDVGEDPEDFRNFYEAHNEFAEVETTIYYNFFIHDNLPVIQYWFYYPFNIWINHHEGDWESILIKLTSELPSSSEICELDYKYHNSHINITGPEEEWYWEYIFNFDPSIIGDPFSGSHYPNPNVFVGGRGQEAKNGKDINDKNHISGASYPAPDKNEFGHGWDTPWYYEEYVDSPYHEHSKRTEDVNLVQLIFRKGWDYPVYCNHYWLSFPGRWGVNEGSINHSPYGPSFGSNSQNWPDSETLLIEEVVLREKQEKDKRLFNSSEKKHLTSLDKNQFIDTNKPKDLFISSDLLSFVCSPNAFTKEEYTPITGSQPIFKNNTSLNIFDKTDPITLSNNPAITQTTIQLDESLTENEPALISIYDISGRLIKSVETKTDYTWDLTSDTGNSVSSGIYIIHIQTLAQNKVMRLAVVR